ncbi:MAG: hypothetical protein KDN22_30060 [Verrucomicrobiae bacterium]|nr:hypothetical protein [Verrucomicrobiae bacterium]
MRLPKPQAPSDVPFQIDWRCLAVILLYLLLFDSTAVPAVSAPNEQLYASALPRPQAAIAPRGMIIYKKHVQADELAPFVEYSSLKVVANTAIDVIRHDGGGLFSIPKQQLVYHIVYPQETDELITDAQFERIGERLERLRSLAVRYQKSATALEPWIARLEHEVTMWESGFCRVEGQWVNRVGFHYDQKVAELRRAFEDKRAEILGTPAPQPADDEVAVQVEENPLPPMWTLDLERQIQEEEATAQEAKRKERERARQQRSQEFQDKVEEERPFRTGWRIKA